jgi:hypothetical protein
MFAVIPGYVLMYEHPEGVRMAIIHHFLVNFEDLVLIFYIKRREAVSKKFFRYIFVIRTRSFLNSCTACLSLLVVTENYIVEDG